MIREHVEAITNATQNADAFDVIELMRLRETPMVLEGYRESLADQRPTAVELVALILLARGVRVLPDADPRGAHPAKVVPDLHERAGVLLSVGQFMLLSDGQAEKFGPLTTLAATYVGHELNVKFKQYAHVHDGLNEALFSSKHLGTILLETLGFTYEDFLAVREAIRKCSTTDARWSKSSRSSRSPKRPGTAG